MTYDPNLRRPVDTQSDREPDAAPSGGSGFLIAGILIAALIIGGYFFLLWGGAH